jgi:hypothetical protein
VLPPRPQRPARVGGDPASRVVDQHDPLHAGVRVALHVTVVHPRARPDVFAGHDLEAGGIPRALREVVDERHVVVGPGE